MVPIDQTITGPEDGNCFAACLASILELPIEQVPNICHLGEDWLTDCNKWLRRFGFWMVPMLIEGVNMQTQEREPWKPEGWHIIAGDNQNGDRHAVVGYNGRTMFDPNPNRKGLKNITEYYVFVSRCPWTHPDESALRALDNLSEFLGNSDGQTNEEIESELIEEMGEERYLTAKKEFMVHIEKLRINAIK
jgi:hypothetical protein